MNEVKPTFLLRSLLVAGLYLFYLSNDFGSSVVVGFSLQPSSQTPPQQPAINSTTANNNQTNSQPTTKPSPTTEPPLNTTDPEPSDTLAIPPPPQTSATPLPPPPPSTASKTTPNTTNGPDDKLVIPPPPIHPLLTDPKKANLSASHPHCQFEPLTLETWKKLKIDDYLKNYPNGKTINLIVCSESLIWE